MRFEPVRYLLRIESDRAMNAVVRDEALLGQPIDMLYRPACGFRYDLGGDKLSQACWQLYYFVLLLWFRFAILLNRGLPDGQARSALPMGPAAPWKSSTLRPRAV